MIRLGLLKAPVAVITGASMMLRNQRFERRSKRTFGSVENTDSPASGGVMTEAKNTSGSALITPSATPVVLLKVRIRPLMNTKNCVGPTAPSVSGGKAPVSVGPV